jgi:hypothetical protein
MTIPMLRFKPIAFLLFLGAVALGSARVEAAVLSLPDTAQGGPGALVDVPISVNPGTGVLGIDMRISYDPAVLSAQNVTVSGIAATQGFALVRNLNTAGLIIISEYAMQDALVGSGEIAKIQFLVTGAFGTTSALTFDSATINENGIPFTPDNGLFTVTCLGATNGTACNDGNACTVNETCQSGACTGGAALLVPGEIANLMFAADDATLTWSSASGAGPGTVHDVLRGLVSQFPVGTGGGESCLGSIAAATTSDAAIPPLMNGYWYLVRGRNACGTGTYGFRTVGGAPGAERTSTSCP